MIKYIKSHIAIALAVAVFTFIVFLPSLKNDFVMWDDDAYVYDNLFIRSFDARLLTSAFTDVSLTGLWHPLTWLSHALDYAVWGLDPLGHHLTNNIIHALNTFIIVLLIMTLLKAHTQVDTGSGGSPPALNDRAMLITAATAGLLFGIHPLRVESVAWVSERKDLLSAFFYLLTIVAYTRYVGATNTRASAHASSPFRSGNYFLAIGLFILALLSKPMAVSLPLVLLILDWHPYRRIRSLETFRTAFIEKTPFIILSLSVSIVTLFSQESAKAVLSMEQSPLASRLVLAAQSLVFYPVKMLAPVHLVPVYPPPLHASIVSANSLFSIIIVGAITAACIGMARKQRVWISVWGYYLVTVAPVLGVVQVGTVSRADRFTYLPSIGFFLLLGLLSAKTHEKISSTAKRKSALRMAEYVLAITVIGFLSYTTIQQIGIWRNSITFWSYVINVFPDSFPMAHNNLGFAYAKQHRYNDALKEYAIVIKLSPGLAEPHNNSGIAYTGLNRIDEAISEYSLALQLTPAYPEAHNNLGIAYLSQKRYSEATNEFKAALALRPDFVEAHYNLGNAYAAMGLSDQAIYEYQAAIALDPGEPDAHEQLGYMYMKQNRLNEAAKELELARELALMSNSR